MLRLNQFLFCFTLVFLWASAAQAQSMTVSGELYDSLNFRPVSAASVTLSQTQDSTQFITVKTDYIGSFQANLALSSSFRVSIMHPKYRDTVFTILNTSQSTEIQFGRILLSENAKTFTEVEVLAVLPVAFKGDTVVFAADSFAVRPNAKVEELLKKLPGLEINAEGQFVVNGKIVEKILIDGEEFLSLDFTTTTKNINANAIQSVQVYETQPKNKASSESSEKIQVINLKLKKEAKNSLTSDITLGSDMQEFYDNHVFTTRFNEDRRFGLLLKNFNTENSGTMRNTRGKVEFSVQDQLTKKLYLNARYNLDYLQGKSNEDLLKQYLFSDSSFSIQEQNSRLNFNLNNALVTELTYKKDTLTKLTSKTELKKSKTEKERSVLGYMYTDNAQQFGDSRLISSDLGERYEIINESDYLKTFLKERRSLAISNRFAGLNDFATSNLDIENNNAFNPEDSVRVNQDKRQFNKVLSNVFLIRYTEPIFKNWSIQFTYSLNYEQSKREISSYNMDANGGYTLFDTIFSNNFKNRSATNIGSVQLRYEKEKHDFSIRSRYSYIQLNNSNLSNGEIFERSLGNFQYQVKYDYKIKKSLTLNVDFNSQNKIPSIAQFQPIPDNSNPNQIFLGNPELKPPTVNEMRANFRKWSPDKKRNFNLRIFGTLTTNDFSTATNFNSSGQNVVQTINIDESYRVGYSTNIGFPLFKYVMLRFEQGSNLFVSENLINEQLNESSALNQSTSLSLKFDNTGFLDSELVFRTNYSQTKNSLSTFTRPSFWSFRMEYNINIRLPQRFEISSQVNGYYITNTNISDANYLIWNAQVKRKFLKKEQLTCGLAVRDILNQTRSISRTVNANLIMDSNAELIARYFLFSITYNFQKNIKTSPEDS